MSENTNLKEVLEAQARVEVSRNEVLTQALKTISVIVAAGLISVTCISTAKELSRENEFYRKVSALEARVQRLESEGAPNENY